jgi:hypothetical protein
MTDNTEPTIDELVEMCFDDLCINNTGNYIRITFGDKSMNVDYEHFLAFRKRIEALISDQVAKARLDELEHLFDRADGERSARRYTAILEQRIKVLRTRLNGVKNK